MIDIFKSQLPPSAMQLLCRSSSWRCYGLIQLRQCKFVLRIGAVQSIMPALRGNGHSRFQCALGTAHATLRNTKAFQRHAVWCAWNNQSPFLFDLNDCRAIVGQSQPDGFALRSMPRNKSHVRFSCMSAYCCSLLNLYWKPDSQYRQQPKGQNWLA